MVFEKIDKNSWNRKEYFDHYFASVPCTYSMTVKVDITQIKEKGMKLYPAMLYYIAMIVNRHSEFRTAINQDGELGIYYESDTQRYGNNHRMEGKPNAPENIFNVSMIPWSTFDGFNLNLQKGYDYLIPIFTMGKYYKEDNKIILPLAIQVHHAVCDGFHICRFVNELQELINS